MVISQKGLDLIKEFEGCVLKAYKDPGSNDGLPITIGVGSTMYTDGTRIKLGDTITEQKAMELLKWEVNLKSAVINAHKLPLNQNQFDALCSFVFNVGAGNFNDSTLLKKAKKNVNDPSIKDEFMKWNKNNKKVMKGLTNRRAKEAALYFSK